jgi:hypothetical protein
MATIDVVYGLHDFVAEHEDEISFKSGEKIEVVEKDDEFGDGWWQGRATDGKVGLFPRDYTTTQPPGDSQTAPQVASTSSTSTILPSLTEEPENESSLRTTPTIQLNGQDHHDTESTDGHHPGDTTHATSSSSITEGGGPVMQATLTDVQAAIDQLGRNRDDNRSISFVSERDFTENETDTDDPSEWGDGNGNVDSSGAGEAWHKGAREKLAEKARKALEEAEKMEKMIDEQQRQHTLGMGLGWQRLVAPPIEVEMSDESEDDEEDDQEELRRRLGSEGSYDDIPEEDEPEEENTRDYTQDITIPEFDEDASKTATNASFTLPSSSPPPFPQSPPQQVRGILARSTSPPIAQEAESRNSNTPIRESLIALPSSTSPSPANPAVLAGGSASPKHDSFASSRSALVFAPSPTQAQPSTQVLVQSPDTTEGPSASNAPPLPLSPVSLTHNAGGSAASGQTATALPVISGTNGQAASGASSTNEKKHPTEWGVPDVVDWLKTRGFDEDTCDKFVEQEITGDVLLELDAALLKSELGIMAFGKRVRIANAISELRRPPSINYNYSDNQSQLSNAPYTPSSLGGGQGQFAQLQQSQLNGNSPGGYGALGTPPTITRALGFGKGHSRGQSLQSSLGSPLSGLDLGMGMPISGHGSIIGETLSEAGESVKAGSESGVVTGKAFKNRPSQLVLSPSDGALGATAAQDDMDKGTLSESELPSAMSMRRRLFGRSHDSALSAKDKENLSMAGSPRSTSSSKGEKEEKKSKDKEKGKTKDKEKDGDSKKGEKDGDIVPAARPRPRSKKGNEQTTKSSDRLSLFGIGGGKGRKPVPRYSSLDEEPVSEKGSPSKDKEKTHTSLSLSRLYGSQARKSGRPATSDGGSKTSEFGSKMDRGRNATMPSSSSSKEPQVLRKRTSTSTGTGSGDQSHLVNGNAGSPTSPSIGPGGDSKEPQLKAGQSILAQIGESDHSGWMRKKGDRYNSWKLRYFVLKGPHMYCLRSNSKSETKIKGYINIVGYKVVVDENINPGKYGFRIVHDQDKTHAFSSEEKSVVREWMKAIMKATIGRDYTTAVISSCNIPTIPLVVAQAMNPAPRPPSPTQRAATQKALRRENPNQLSSRDAKILMGVPSANGNETKETAEQSRTRLESFFSSHTVSSINDDSSVMPPSTATSGGARSSEFGSMKPPRPSRELRRSNTIQSTSTVLSAADEHLIDWANRRLPSHLRIKDPNGPLLNGLGLLRLAEAIKGRPLSPPVPESAFPVDDDDDTLDGLFRLFDFLLDNDVKMGSVSINDVRQGKPEKILQLMKALKAWEDKRKAITESIGKGSVHMGAFMAPVGPGGGVPVMSGLYPRT